MHTESITSKDRNFVSAVVRNLCSKTCTFTVKAEGLDKALLISPFMLYQEKPKERYQEYGFWVAKNKVPANAEITIYLHADLSGQAHKVLELARATATIMTSLNIYQR